MSYVYKVSKIAEKKERERAGLFGAHFFVFFLLPDFVSALDHKSFHTTQCKLPRNR